MPETFASWLHGVEVGLSLLKDGRMELPPAPVGADPASEARILLDLARRLSLEPAALEPEKQSATVFAGILTERICEQLARLLANVVLPALDRALELAGGVLGEGMAAIVRPASLPDGCVVFLSPSPGQRPHLAAARYRQLPAGHPLLAVPEADSFLYEPYLAEPCRVIVLGTPRPGGVIDLETLTRYWAAPRWVQVADCIRLTKEAEAARLAPIAAARAAEKAWDEKQAEYRAEQMSRELLIEECRRIIGEERRKKYAPR
jgi:hypothetical protein